MSTHRQPPTSDPRPPTPRKQIVLAAGSGSRSGDTRRVFGGLRAYLIEEGGFASDDFLEATYAGEYADGRWVSPADYDVAAFDNPLATSIDHCAQALLWWARHPPPDSGGVEWHLVGFSFGGLVLLEAAIRLHRRAYDSWGRRLRSVTTLSSPLNGCDLGDFRWLGDLFGPGAIGAELCALGENPAHRRRLETEVARLRAAGVTVTTLVEADDAIIQPRDGIVGPVDPALVVPSRSSPDVTFVGRYLGHGRIMGEPSVWRRVLEIIGPQGTPGGGARPSGTGRVLVTPPPSVLVTPPPADQELLDRQLAELKQRMRAEGRLPGPPAAKDSSG